MTIGELERKLEELVNNIIYIKNSKEREEALIEIGEYAAQIDIEAERAPDKSAICSRTDCMVAKAENFDVIAGNSFKIQSTVASNTREVKKNFKI